jgi:hypothetical protein
VRSYGVPVAGFHGHMNGSFSSGGVPATACTAHPAQMRERRTQTHRGNRAAGNDRTGHNSTGQDNALDLES